MQTYRRVGEWMVGNGLLTEEQLEQALQQKGQQRQRFGDFLVAQGWVQERDVTRCLAEQFHLEITDLSKIKQQRKAKLLVSSSFALQRLVLPVAFDKEGLHCVVGDPVDVETTDALRIRAGVPVKLTLAPASELRAAIRQAYRLPGATAPATKKRPAKIEFQADRQALVRALENGGNAA